MTAISAQGFRQSLSAVAMVHRKGGAPDTTQRNPRFFMAFRNSTVSLAFRLFCRHDRKEKCLEEDIIRRRSSAL